MSQTLQSFLDALASNAPAPGGGAAAALMGATGAALVSMVCNLTLGKPKRRDRVLGIDRVAADAIVAIGTGREQAGLRAWCLGVCGGHREQRRRESDCGA